MYTLYYAPGTAALLTHQVLIECGAPFTLKDVDMAGGEQRGEAYLALNPNGTIPTLVVDGKPHSETAAMAMLLAERHPEAKLAPEAGSARRADYLEWMVYLANVVQPAFRQWFYADEYVPVSAEAIAKAARLRIEASWERIDAHLAANGPHMLGDRFSVVDLYLVMLMRWSRNMPRPATDWAHLAALAAKVKARPSWKTLYAQEQLTEWA